MSSNVKDVIYSVYRIRMSDYRIISADENFDILKKITEKIN
jgi:hypothetical protein